MIVFVVIDAVAWALLACFNAWLMAQLLYLPQFPFDASDIAIYVIVPAAMSALSVFVPRWLRQHQRTVAAYSLLVLSLLVWAPYVIVSLKEFSAGD